MAFVLGVVGEGGISEGILATRLKGRPRSTGAGVLFKEARCPSAGRMWAVPRGSA